MEDPIHAPAAANPSDEPLGELASRIVREHHETCRRELARLGDRIGNAGGSPGPLPSARRELSVLWGRFSRDLTVHLLKEEQTLFPLIVQLEEACRRGAPPPRLPFGSIENLIRMMRLEHGEEAALLTRVCELLPPAAGDPDRRALLDELASFERALLRHVQLEDEILFARTTALERAARALES